MSESACIACATRPRKGDSELCGGCFARLRELVATVEWAHGWLGVNMAGGASGFKPGSLHRKADSRPPYRLDLSDARTDIHTKLASWAQAIGEEHVPPLAGPLDDSVPSIGRWLRARLPWVSDQPWVDSFIAELAELRGLAYGLAPWDRCRTDLPLPCPAKGCGLLTLALYGGDDAVICRSRDCGHIMTAYEYKKGVKEWIQRRQEEAAKAAEAKAQAA
jgi:hypothetical protein